MQGLLAVISSGIFFIGEGDMNRLVLFLVWVLLSSLAVAQDWQVEINGTSRDISAKQIDSLIYVDVVRLSAAVGLPVEIDERNRIVKIQRPGLVDYSRPAEERETYELRRRNGTLFTFTYLGYTYHPSRCLTTADGKKISLCPGDKEPVSMMLIRFRIGNPEDRPLTLNRSFLDFYVVDENQHTTGELNFWFTVDTRLAKLPILLPGQSVELFSVVDVAEEPEPIRLLVEYNSDKQMLEFPLNGYSSGSSEPQPGDVRVVITGFEVKNATSDDPLNLDGCGDEVFVHAGVWIFRAPQGGNSPFGDDLFFERAYQQRTPVIGDVNGYPERIKGGSGNVTSCPSLSPPDGGFLNGDKFPTSRPREISGTPIRTKLPMLVYQGPITDSMLVAIMPTIWEWGGDASMYNVISRWMLERPRNSWASEIRGVRIKGSADRFSLARLAQMSNAVDGTAHLFSNRGSEIYYTGAPDRPIGATIHRTSLSLGRSYYYSPFVIALNATNVQRILDNGGLITLDYNWPDPNSPDGYDERYLLHLRVEQF